MFRSLRLSDAFQHLLTSDEWRWFGPMVARGTYHYDLDGWPTFSIMQLQNYARVWREAADQALARLRAGEWLAEGISSQYGPKPVSVAIELWDYLSIKDRVDEAEGAGFHFIALTVSDPRPSHEQVSHADTAKLRRLLTEWIRTHAAGLSEPPLRSIQLAAAREAFAGSTISDNLYRECRRAAGLSQGSVQRGRPKTKG
jgi:hypothetical protein